MQDLSLPHPIDCKAPTAGLAVHLPTSSSHLLGGALSSADQLAALQEVTPIFAACASLATLKLQGCNQLRPHALQPLCTSRTQGSAQGPPVLQHLRTLDISYCPLPCAELLALLLHATQLQVSPAHRGREIAEWHSCMQLPARCSAEHSLCCLFTATSLGPSCATLLSLTLKGFLLVVAAHRALCLHLRQPALAADLQRNV